MASSVVGKFRTYLDHGYYDEHNKRYLNFFPASQMKIIMFEDLCNKPGRVIKDVWRFLKISPNIELKDIRPRGVALGRIGLVLDKIGRFTKLRKVVPSFLRVGLRHFLFKLGDRPPKMDASTWKRLIEHYRPHNRKLEKKLGCDLSHWNR